MNLYKKIPAFIIGGAMKSGTTTLHHLLNTHSEIFIPDPEIHYFSMDDIFLHQPLRSRMSGEWIWNKYDESPSKPWNWYCSFFDDAKPDQIIGEDSTHYLFSSLVPERILKRLPHVKMIFLLRNPVDRAWSQYLHMLRRGKMLWDFDKSIEVQPATLLMRGLYKEHLEKWYTLFQAENIKVVLFEDLLKNTEAVLMDVAIFLGLNTRIENFDLKTTQFNKARFPKYQGIQLWRNRALQGIDRRINSLHFPNKINSEDWGDSFGSRLIERINILINPHSSENKPCMKLETRKLLNEFYKFRNQGLSELIDNPAVDLWYEE